MEIFSAKLCIFEQKFPDEKICDDNFLKAQNLKGRIPPLP